MVRPRVEDLPTTVAVFPLTGVLLVPGGRLPLNIFEPRYLNLVEDAMASGRMMAMAQPREPRDPMEETRDEDGLPALYDVACLGRIVSFEETGDGRLAITLLGLSRFHVREELPMQRGYRRVRVCYHDFAGDLEPPAEMTVDRDRLFAVLKPFAARHGLSFNWDLMREVDSAPLLTSLAMVCPFEPREKQALLEAANPQARAELMLALLEMGAMDAGDGSGQPQ